jgi:putative ABC transport system permease protein
MRNVTEIIKNALRFTLQELKGNKLRTFLSLIGVAFGIFCIIGVLAVVNSMERNLQNEVASLGTNTIYIDKWDYSGGGPNAKWWKLMARPTMKFEEAEMLRQRTNIMEGCSFLLQTGAAIGYRDLEIKSAGVYGIDVAQNTIQPLKFAEGRYFTTPEFDNGAAVCIIGYENALSLYGSTSNALGKTVDVKGSKLNIVGVINKEGKNFVGWDYDNCVMLPYKFCKTIFDEKASNPIIIAKGKPGVTTQALTDDLNAAMRQIRRLGPTEENNYSLNSVEAFSQAISGFFSTINVIGFIIGIISLIVGLFGIANIMFVTVKERTNIIGLKKAIGAKSRTILLEFLLEALVLCIFGGAIGLILVLLLAQILSGVFSFPVFLSPPMLIFTVIICVVVGIIAGLFPARQAAKLNPVVAIRS